MGDDYRTEFFEETLRALKLNQKMAEYMGEEELSQLLNLSISYLERESSKLASKEPRPPLAVSNGFN